MQYKRIKELSILKITLSVFIANELPISFVQSPNKKYPAKNALYMENPNNL